VLFYTAVSVTQNCKYVEAINDKSILRYHMASTVYLDKLLLQIWRRMQCTRSLNDK